MRAMNMVRGLSLPARLDFTCEPCLLGRSARLPFKAGTADFNEPLDCISMDVAGPFVAIVYAAPVQLLAYHVAVFMGKDVDQPRNLAKSVTVE